MPTFKELHGSVQTGYTDLRRLVLCGLVRQVQAAGGRTWTTV